MKHLVESIQAVALSFGGPGLFLIAFLDSSFLSFPQANDLLIVWMVMQRKPLMPFYAGMATLGSVAGCVALYYVVRRGGDAFLRKRFRASSLDRGMAVVRRYGVVALFVPSLLPPPAPFKLFVVMAAVAEIPVAKFVTAIALGRGLRYFGIGLLTLWYGEAAMGVLRANPKAVWAIVGVLVVGGGVAVMVWGRRSGEAAEPR